MATLPRLGVIESLVLPERVAIHAGNRGAGGAHKETKRLIVGEDVLAYDRALTVAPDNDGTGFAYVAHHSVVLEDQSQGLRMDCRARQGRVPVEDATSNRDTCVVANTNRPPAASSHIPRSTGAAPIVPEEAIRYFHVAGPKNETSKT